MQSATYLLLYWRDESSHGKLSEISELDAYHALTLLLRLARHLYDEWDRLTKAAP